MKKHSPPHQKVLKYQFYIISAILLIWMVGAHSIVTKSSAYIDPSLTNMSAGTGSVIVTAESSETALAAIESVGGQVSKELWLIDAASGVLSYDQIEKLATMPGVVSIVSNYDIGTSASPFSDSTSYEDEVQDDDSAGYVTNMRITKRKYIHTDPQLAPATALPDGGFVSIDEKGGLTITNEDGTERATLNLTSGGPFYTAPQVSSNGTIFIAGEGKHLYALNADGSIRWKFKDGAESFKGGAILSPDERIVYITDEKRKVYALDTASGEPVWQHKVDNSDGSVKSSPAIDSTGVLYFVTDKGYLTAISASGQVLWTFHANGGGPYILSPLVGSNNLVYIAGEDKRLTGVNRDTGMVAFELSTNSKILAQPALATDGSLFVVAEDRTLYGVNADGTVRFTYRPGYGKFKTTPVLSQDGSMVFVANEESAVYAIDAADGSLIWEHQTLYNLSGGLVLDSSGNLLVADESGTVVMLNPKGVIVYRTVMHDVIKETPTVDSSGNISIRVGQQDVVVLGMLPNSWNGRPDVQPTGDKKVYDVVTPVSIDIGADILHQNMIDGDPITGDGITIAIVDTGVFFTKEVQNILTSKLSKNYLGQADFVEPVCETWDDKKKTYVLGIQYNDHCFQDHYNSKDGYGHGSHVAGIVMSNFSDNASGVTLGVAPDAQVLSVRVLDDEGHGTYETVIAGIQYVVEHKDTFNVRVMNLSLSAPARVPYFVDPLNRAAEVAWANGIVVVAAAGNTGPGPQTVSVPGADPYVITVGAINSNRTPGYWADDEIPYWSATGPTLDGFIKPDVLAPGSNIVSFMHNDPGNDANTARLVLRHPDYSETDSLFRMNGTSMATAVASGVAALMLDVEPTLTPDQVKYRLMASAKNAMTAEGDFAYNLFQQGMGRIWAPDAVLWDESIPTYEANYGMDIHADLAHPWTPGDSPDPLLNPDLLHHYFGPVMQTVSDDGESRLFFIQNLDDGTKMALGAHDIATNQWLDYEGLTTLHVTSEDGAWEWNEDFIWAGGYMWVGADGYVYDNDTSYGWVAPGGYMWVGADEYALVGPDGYMWVGAGGYMWVGAGGYMWVGAGGYMWVGAGGYMWVGAGGYMWVGAGGYMWVGANTLLNNASWQDDIATDSANVLWSSWVADH